MQTPRIHASIHPHIHARVQPLPEPPGLCWREVLHLALDGVGDADLRIEMLLDRIEHKS